VQLLLSRLLVAAKRGQTRRCLSSCSRATAPSDPWRAPRSARSSSCASSRTQQLRELIRRVKPRVAAATAAAVLRLSPATRASSVRVAALRFSTAKRAASLGLRQRRLLTSPRPRAPPRPQRRPRSPPREDPPRVYCPQRLGEQQSKSVYLNIVQRARAQSCPSRRGSRPRRPAGLGHHLRRL
jgi:hypothetical protein